MLSIAVSLDVSGALRSLHLEGHAGDSPSGENLACAAVTLMVRTVARLVESQAEWTVDGLAPVPGNLFLEITRRPEDTDEWLRGVTDTLLWALADIVEEYPDAITVSLEEKSNGS